MEIANKFAESLRFGEDSPLQIAEQQLRLGVTQHLQHGTINLQKIAGGRAAADGIGDILDQRAITMFGDAETALRHQ